MNIRPVYYHLIAKKVIREAKSTGGILLTASGEDETTHAEIISVGPGVQADIKVGDIVTYIEGDSRIHREKIDNEYIMIMPEDCVLGVVEEKTED